MQCGAEVHTANCLRINRAERDHSVLRGTKVFAGQRQEGFYVDLGSIFDLGALRPFQNLHLLPLPAVNPGVNGTKHLNVHTIALQVPIGDLTKDGSSTFSGVGDPGATAMTSRAGRGCRFRGSATRSSMRSSCP